VSVAFAVFIALYVDVAFVAHMSDSILNVVGVLFAGALAAVSITLGYLGLPSFSQMLERHEEEKRLVYVHFCSALKDDVIVMLFSLVVVIFLIVFEKIDLKIIKKRETVKKENQQKNDNEIYIFQVSGNYRTYNAEKRENKVRNTEYGRNSLENIESHGREI